jgi:hypothetical protein
MQFPVLHAAGYSKLKFWRFDIAFKDRRYPMKWLEAVITVILRGALRFVFAGFGLFGIYWSLANGVYAQAALSVVVTLACLIWIYADLRRALAEAESK